MPAKKALPNRKDIGILPHLDKLQEHIDVIGKHAINQPLTEAQKSQLTSLAITALKVAGISSTDITAEMHSQFPPSDNSFVPLPAPQPVRQEVVPDRTVSGLFGKRN